MEERDKPVAMGFGLMLMALFAFIPSPIFFGILLDRSCVVWGKTCSGTGNCWLYDGEVLRCAPFISIYRCSIEFFIDFVWYFRYSLNICASVFVAIGVFFDGGVWYLVKDLKIFDDEEPKDTKLAEIKNTEEPEKEAMLKKENEVNKDNDVAKENDIVQ